MKSNKSKAIALISVVVFALAIAALKFENSARNPSNLSRDYRILYLCHSHQYVPVECETCRGGKSF